MSFITNNIIIKRWTIVKRKVHAHGGSIELIKLRVMSDESIAHGQAML